MARSAPDPDAEDLSPAEASREIQALRREVASLKRRLAEAEALADVDALVPVLNRRAFVRELGRVIAEVERYGTPASVLYFDLDGFKAVNDRFGHAAGDAALAAAAQRLKARIRRSDVLGRLGGDEFAVILSRAGPAVARAKAEALAGAVGAEPVAFEGREIPLTASWGVSEIGAGDRAEQVLARADAGMYLRKPAR